MINCNSSNPEELRNLVKNRGKVYNVKANQTQQESAANLQHTTDNFKKVNGWYRLLIKDKFFI